jgi:hypothetical protein
MMFLRACKALALLVGANAPKQRMTHDISMSQDNPEAIERVARLAAFIQRTGAISVEGRINPPLPPGMAERVAIESTNGQDHYHDGSAKAGHGMWSMVLEYPRD